MNLRHWIVVSERPVEGLPWFRAPEVIIEKREFADFSWIYQAFDEFGRALRGIGIDVYHHITSKHTGRYVDEFAFRLNDGNVARPTLDRLDSFIEGMAQKRLTYKDLIAVPEGN